MRGVFFKKVWMIEIETTLHENHNSTFLFHFCQSFWSKSESERDLLNGEKLNNFYCNSCFPFVILWKCFDVKSLGALLKIRGARCASMGNFLLCKWIIDIVFFFFFVKNIGHQFPSQPFCETLQWLTTFPPLPPKICSLSILFCTIIITLNDLHPRFEGILARKYS